MSHQLQGIGPYIGRRFGPALLSTRLAVRYHDRIERSRTFMREKGPAAVFLGRFVALFRAMVPALAGLSHAGEADLAAIAFEGCVHRRCLAELSCVRAAVMSANYSAFSTP